MFGIWLTPSFCDNIFRLHDAFREWAIRYIIEVEYLVALDSIFICHDDFIKFWSLKVEGLYFFHSNFVSNGQLPIGIRSSQFEDYKFIGHEEESVRAFIGQR